MRLGLADLAQPLVPHLAAGRRVACGRGDDELLARLGRGDELPPAPRRPPGTGWSGRPEGRQGRLRKAPIRLQDLATEDLRPGEGRLGWMRWSRQGGHWPPSRKRSQSIGLIPRGAKRAGKPGAGNRHAGFDRAGTGDGPTANLHGHAAGNGGHSQEEPPGYRASLDPTRDFSSLEQALAAAELRRASLQAELVKLDGNQPAFLQLTPAALARHLEGMTEKLRSGANGKVREAIQQSVAKILVGVDGSLTIEAKPGGLLGVERIHARLDGEEEGGLFQQSFHSTSDRRWRVTMASR
jgi:hypothetical protein